MSEFSLPGATRGGLVERHHALDGLRGLAALAVASYHFLHHRLDVTVQSMGTFTVYLFFTLSALTMLMVYGERFAAAIERDAAMSFYRARVARIMPLLVLVSFVAVALSRFDPAVAFNGLMTTTGLFAIAGPGTFSVGNGAWSLGIELVFYAVFPVLALTLRRWSVAQLAGLLAASVLAQQLFIHVLPERDFWNHYTTPLTFAPFFIAGFIVHRLAGRRSPGFAIAALFVLAGLALASFALPGDLTRNPAAYVGLSAAAMFAVWLAWRSELPGWAQPLAAFFGEISYSLYLTHWFAFVAVNRLCLALGWPPAVEWPLFLLVALTGAWACCRLFEQPLRRLSGARRPLEPAPLTA